MCYCMLCVGIKVADEMKFANELATKFVVVHCSSNRKLK